MQSNATQRYELAECTLRLLNCPFYRKEGSSVDHRKFLSLPSRSPGFSTSVSFTLLLTEAACVVFEKGVASCSATQRKDMNWQNVHYLF